MTTLEELLGDSDMPAIGEQLTSAISQVVTISSNEFLVAMLRYAVVEAARRLAVKDRLTYPSNELIEDSVDRVLSLTMNSTKKEEESNS